MIIKRTFWLKKSLIFLFLGLFCIFIISCMFPQKSDIDEILKEYIKKESSQERVKILKKMLWEVHNPDNREEDNISGYAIGGLTRLFLKKNDEAILIAVDETEIDGGFANNVCIFYQTVSKEKGFIERYSKQENLPAIERCLGITFNEDELSNIKL